MNPTTSLNRTLTDSVTPRDQLFSPADSRSMIRWGSTLRRRRSPACALHLELCEQPRLERGVRILERLEPADVGLEPLETPGEPAVLLVELVGRRVGRQLVPVKLVRSPSADVAPRRTDTIVALWNRVRSADASGAISPCQQTRRWARRPPGSRAPGRSRGRLGSPGGTCASRRRRAERRPAGRRR